MQRWSYPTSIRFGAGAIDQLAEACATHGIERPLLVTDPGLADRAPIERSRAVLAAEGVDHDVFANVHANPHGGDVESGAEQLRAGGHDGVIAIGGGSALDAGKLVAFAARQAEPWQAYENANPHALNADPAAIAPVVAIPTTAGTGSEVGRAAVITCERERRKLIVAHPAMLPVEVIADPLLTLELPPATTAGTGMDALSHSLEALCAPTDHPMSHAIGLEGCRLVFEHLPQVMRDPGDVDSRGRMLIAASMGAVAFQKGLGAMHALSHPIGAQFGTHHGTTNAVLMPYVLAANRHAIAATIESVAAYCAIAGGFDGFVEHVVDLRASIGIPHTLAELGVPPDALDTVVDAAIVDPTAATNPVPLTREHAAAIFTAAHAGTIDRQPAIGVGDPSGTRS